MVSESFGISIFTVIMGWGSVERMGKRVANSSLFIGGYGNANEKARGV
jgi:hypothetical protein